MDMNIKNLPKKVFDLFPRWSYQCPKCGKQYDDEVQVCNQCGTLHEHSKWRVPPRFLKSHEAMSEYAHRVLAPKLSSKQRELLFKYFTELFSSGWEDSGGSDITDNGAWTGTDTTSGDTLEVVSSPVNEGSYAAHAQVNESGDHAYCYKSVTAQSEIYVRMYVRYPSAVTSDAGVEIFLYSGGSARAFFRLLYPAQNGTYIKLYNYVTSSDYDSSTFNTSTDTWYCIELGWKKGNGDGFLKSWFDGELKQEETGLNTGTNDIDTVKCGIGYAWRAVEIYFDSVVIADTYIGPEEEEEPPAGAAAGFETGDTSEFDDTETSSGTVTATDEYDAHHGDYYCKCDVNADGSAYAEGYFDILEQQPVYCRGYFRFNQFPETNRDYTIIAFENTDGPTTVGYVQLIDDGGTDKWKMRRTTGGGATYSTSTSNIPSVDTWVCVEFAHGENLAKLWVDGDELLSYADATDQTIDRVHIGACSKDIDADDTLEIHIDCIVVTDKYIGTETEVDNLIVNNVATIGADTNLYQSAPNTLKTDYKFAANEIQVGTFVLSTDQSGFTTSGNFSIGEILFTKHNVFLTTEVPHLNKLEIVNAIYGFEDGKWKPEGLLNDDRQIDSKIVFEDLNDPEDENDNLFAHLFAIVSDNPDEIDPLVATDVGLVVQKDIAAGGFISANQGELHLGFGREHRLGEPAIRLSFADASKLYGGGMSEIPPVPKGPQQSDPPDNPTEGEYYLDNSDPPHVHCYIDSAWTDVTVNGQIFWLWQTDPPVDSVRQYKEYYNEQEELIKEWINLGDSSDFAGNFDTLYLRKGFSNTPANMNVGTLFASQVTSSEQDLIISAPTTGKNIYLISSGYGSVYMGPDSDTDELRFTWDTYNTYIWPTENHLMLRTESGKDIFLDAGSVLKVESVSEFHDNVDIGSHIQFSEDSGDIICNSVTGISTTAGLKAGDPIYLAIALQSGDTVLNAFNQDLKLTANSNYNIILDPTGTGIVDVQSACNISASLRINGTTVISAYRVLQNVTIGGDLIPVYGINPDLGDSTHYYDNVYANTYNYHTTSTLQHFDSLDDLAIIKNSKPVKVVDKDGIEREMVSLEGGMECVLADGSREFASASKINGLIFGAIKQLIAKVEALEAEVKGNA